jgi:signal transduction histidine kinase
VETVERLRDFSRQSSEEAEAVPTDLNSMVHEAIEISKPRLSGIQLVLQLGTPPLTLIRPADCVTAIVNLLFNAADALQGKGTITVLTGSSEVGAWVEVADTGPGTGLGVPIVYAFTQRHGGRLEIESEPGHGARFKMWFPAIQHQRPAGQPPSS